MVGRKPKPARLKRSEGDTRRIGVHKLDAQIAAEPKPSSGLPPCAAHLQGKARAAWEFWAAELVGMGLDRRPDAMMLEGACVAYENAVYAHEHIQKYGRIFVQQQLDPKTQKLTVVGMRLNPAVAIGNKAWTHLRAFCSEFGFSPVSRSRLSLEPQDDGMDDLMAILSQPRTRRAGDPIQ
jgi:P27 family predicted phage terminase small subunit